MACNFNCTQLFPLHLKRSIVTSNALTLIHKQTNNEMFFYSLPLISQHTTQRKALFPQRYREQYLCYLGFFHFLPPRCNMSSVCLHGSLCLSLAVINIRLQGAHYESS